jgi:succinyl-CoA synthetase alpha subunit
LEASVSILVDKNTRLLVQGITGRQGSFHTQQMVAYGTNVVAGVTPGRRGQEVAGVPVYDTVAQAMAAQQPNVSIIYVPAPFGADAILESIDAGIPLIVCITENIPILDMVEVYDRLSRGASRLIGPNCPGLITPDEAKVGIMPGYIHRRGPVGLVSRSGTLTYEVAYALTERGLGQSTAVGIGGDPVNGLRFIDVLALFEADPETTAIVLLGEIGGTDEEQAAEYARAHVSKPIVGFIAGRTAPAGKRMGHAGAIISGGTGTAAGKIAALEAAGIGVADSPVGVADLVAQVVH